MSQDRIHHLVFEICVVSILLQMGLIGCIIPKRVLPNGSIRFRETRKFNTTQGQAHILSFKCNPGYTRVGPRAIFCKTEECTAQFPECTKKKSCPDPGVSVDGARKGNCCFVGDVFKYSCKEGFELVGIDTLVCLPTGNWSAPRPFCRPLSDHCSSPPSITNGSVIGEKKGDFYLPYDEVKITCDPGFKYQGFEFNMCFGEIGWDEEFSECKEIFCDQPEPPVNGFIPELQFDKITAFPYGFEITYVCNEGYRLTGDSLRLCSENGWSGDTPCCEAKRSCSDTGVSVNGGRKGNSTFVTDVVQYSCKEGFELVGIDTLVCLPVGNWSASRQLYQQEKSRPGVSFNGARKGNSGFVGNVVQYTCKEGFELVGIDTHVCLPTGNWSASRPLCPQKKSCSDPGIAVNGAKKGNSTFVGDVVQYSCKEGFELVGTDTLVCLSTGNWSAPRPLCRHLDDKGTSGRGSNPVTQGVDELNAPKNPTDRFRTILSDLSENSVRDAVEDFTNYGCEKMVVIRNAAQSAIHLSCRSPHVAPKAVNIDSGNAFVFTFRPRKAGSLFWCNLEYQRQFARFDVYNENLPYMCPRAIQEVYQYTVRNDGVYVDHTSSSGESKIRALSEGYSNVTFWEQFKNNKANGFLCSLLVDGGMCADLPDQFNDKPAAVTLCHNHCVYLYKHYGCLGEVQTVHAGNNCTDTAVVSSLVGRVSSVKGC